MSSHVETVPKGTNIHSPSGAKIAHLGQDSPKVRFETSMFCQITLLAAIGQYDSYTIVRV